MTACRHISLLELLMKADQSLIGESGDKIGHVPKSVFIITGLSGIHYSSRKHNGSYYNGNNNNNDNNNNFNYYSNYCYYDYYIWRPLHHTMDERAVHNVRYIVFETATVGCLTWVFEFQTHISYQVQTHARLSAALFR